jgi:signal transduction histidine kinase
MTNVTERIRTEADEILRTGLLKILGSYHYRQAAPGCAATRRQKVIEDAVETIAPAAAAKGVTLQTALDTGVSLSGDTQRLQQVVWNLLSNAVKFTPRGGRVQVRSQRTNSHVEISISDTGEGIAPEFLPRMFQRFTQADATYSRTHGGLVLGLAICRHIVEAHGGEISATSPGKGKGATIRVELPMMIAQDEPGNVESERPAAESVLTAPLTGDPTHHEEPESGRDVRRGAPEANQQGRR